MIGKTVLVVDTNPATLARVREAFERSDFEVLSARSVDQAKAHASSKSIDLAFSAVRLPGGHSGYELARSLRESHPAALVYLLSGGFDVYDADRAAEAGVDGRIKVPFTAKSLRGRVEEALGPLTFKAMPEPQAVDVEPVPLPVAAQISEELLRTIPEGALSPALPVQPAPVSDERLATFLPRDFRYAEPVAVDPAVVGPAIERAIMEVLPEVVEGILRNALVTSPSFREMVGQAVEKAVAEALPEALASRRR
ncbi:MAG: response regulator [Alphaproteobacteria bacterium]|nr:response regulator [Alphaproteobacteria bacterium]MCB9791785.1 response regulator [Alphaproteobacteria bacterium]